MKILLFILILICSVSCVPFQLLNKRPLKKPQDIWSNCGKASDHLKIGKVTITPDPPQIGVNITVDASGTLDETITSGTLYIELEWSGIVLLNNTYDLCSQLVQVGLKCPLDSGATQIRVSELIPSNAPPGDYTATVIIGDQKNQEVTCIALNFSLTMSTLEKTPEPKLPPQLLKKLLRKV